MLTLDNPPTMSTKRRNLIKRVVPEPMSKEEFNKLTRPQKAIMVAKDALELLRNRLVNAAHCYVNVDGLYHLNIDTNTTSATSEEGKCALFAANKCHVCAKGALFMSTVMRTNKMTLEDTGNVWRSTIIDKVCRKADIFSRDMFDMIENAFEGTNINSYGQVEKEKDSTKPHMKNYYKKFSSSRERLAAILINIIRNNGSFVPTKTIKPSDVKRALAVKARK